MKKIILSFLLAVSLPFLCVSEEYFVNPYPQSVQNWMYGTASPTFTVKCGERFELKQYALHEYDAYDADGNYKEVLIRASNPIVYKFNTEEGTALWKHFAEIVYEKDRTYLRIGAMFPENTFVIHFNDESNRSTDYSNKLFLDATDGDGFSNPQTIKFDVEPGDMKITFPELADARVGDLDFTLNATADIFISDEMKDPANKDEDYYLPRAPIKYTTSDNSVAYPYVDDSGISRIHIAGAGKATITAVGETTRSYTSSSPVSRTLTVKKRNAGLVFSELSQVTYTDTLKIPYSGGSFFKSESDDPVRFLQTGGSGIVNIWRDEDEKVTFIVAEKPGDVTVKAYQNETNSYYADSATRLLRINKKAQRIDFPQPATVTKEVSILTLPPFTSEGLEIVYKSSNINTAYFDLEYPNLLHIQAPGETTVTASHPGNDYYQRASDVQRHITVGYEPQTIRFTMADTNRIDKLTYSPTNTTFTVSAESSAGLPVTFKSENPEIVSINGNLATVRGAGRTNIIASAPASGRIVAVSTKIAVVISPAEQSLPAFATLTPKKYRDAPFRLQPDTVPGSRLPVIYQSSDPSVVSISDNNLATINSAGHVLITATQPGNNNYKSAEKRDLELVVDKIQPVIVFEPERDHYLVEVFVWALPRMYEEGNTDRMVPENDEDGHSYLTTTTPDIVEMFNGFPYFGKYMELRGSGTVEVIAHYDGSKNYYEAAPVKRTFSVINEDKEWTPPTAEDPERLFYEFDPIMYGNSPILLFNRTVMPPTTYLQVPISYTSSNPSVAVIDTLTNQHYDLVVIKGVGSTDITGTAVFPYPEGNKTVVETHTLTVTKATQIIALASIPTKVYGDPNFTLQRKSDAGLDITYEIPQHDVAELLPDGYTVKINGAGYATIIASQTGNEYYAPATKVTKQLYVQKKTLNVVVTLAPETRSNILYASSPESPVIIPENSYDVHYETFKNGDDENSLKEKPVIAYANITGDEPSIILLSGEDNNYEYNLVVASSGHETATAINPVGSISSSASISPNPVKGIFTVKSDSQIKSIEVFDMNGSKRLSISGKGENSISVDLTSYPKGYYLVRINSSFGSEVKRIIKN